MKKSVIISLVLASLALFSFSFAGCSNGEDGLNGKDGVDGKDGTGLIWKGELASAPSNPGNMWAYYNTTDGCSYVWTGSKWDLLNGTSKTTFDVEKLDLTKNELPVRIVEGGVVKTAPETRKYYFKDDILYGLVDADFLKDLYEVSEITKDTTEVVITKKTNDETRNTKATFDLAHRTLSFDNYDAFFQNSDVYYDLVGTYPYLMRTAAASSNIAGQEIELSWASQNVHIGLYNDNGTYLLAIPNQFLKDIFDCAYQVVYNGRYIYETSDLDEFPVLREDYYRECTTKGTRTQTLAEFTYNELCLNLDFNYGLKAIHGIEAFPDFDTYFIAQGIKNDLKSTNAVTFTKALIDVVNFYFGDGHSAFKKNSCWAGEEKITGNKTSKLVKKYFDTRDRYGDARAKAIGGSASYNEDSGESTNIPAYAVSSDGKTAIVRFDAFTCRNYETTATVEEKREMLKDNELLNNYVDADREEDSQYDTISLIAAVHQRISSTPTVENVVLDLSRNGGGRFTAAAYVIAWMLGECTLDFTNPITGAKFSFTYTIDADLNGTCGEEADSVKAKNLFCLISPMSFSCGNLTPAVLKESDRVTILGVTSGGGASSVQHTSCADGSAFQISSKYVMSTSKNGSNYDMDQGVEPHYYINRAENFYKTDTLAALINSINSGKTAVSSN